MAPCEAGTLRALHTLHALHTPPIHSFSRSSTQTSVRQHKHPFILTHIHTSASTSIHQHIHIGIHSYKRKRRKRKEGKEKKKDRGHHTTPTPYRLGRSCRRGRRSRCSGRTLTCCGGWGVLSRGKSKKDFALSSQLVCWAPCAAEATALAQTRVVAQAGRPHAGERAARESPLPLICTRAASQHHAHPVPRLAVGVLCVPHTTGICRASQWRAPLRQQSTCTRVSSHTPSLTRTHRTPRGLATHETPTHRAFTRHSPRAPLVQRASQQDALVPARPQWVLVAPPLCQTANDRLLLAHHL